MVRDEYDLVVVGAGSGGIGTALAAARQGLQVLLVEQGDRLGGTAVQAGVHCWEMGAGGTGLPFDIYRRLRRRPHAVGIYRYGRHMSWQPADALPYRFPGGEHVIDPALRYVDTLQRHGAPELRPTEEFCRRVWHGVPFEADDYAAVVAEMLAETGCCTVATRTGFTDVAVERGALTALLLTNGVTVRARAYVDATGDVKLCRLSGCSTLIGQEDRQAFGEPSAPEESTAQVNGVTLAYRVTPVADPGVESLPSGISGRCWWRTEFPVASFNQYPRGDLNVNMLPTMEGAEFFSLRPRLAYEECRRRALAHWHHLQSGYHEFQAYRLRWIAPRLGVRESYRTMCEHMLTESDIRSGIHAQPHADIVCIADHALDTHGSTTGRQGCAELAAPYGVPYRCLVPRGFRNLLVACRGAGFTSLAASSCRLSRTMMQLGQAAGTAVALALELGCPLPDVPPEALRGQLRLQHAQVDWPMDAGLHDHLLDEDAP